MIVKAALSTAVLVGLALMVVGFAVVWLIDYSWGRD